VQPAEHYTPADWLEALVVRAAAHGAAWVVRAAVVASPGIRLALPVGSTAAAAREAGEVGEVD
jgi:hypothetical protein